MKHCYEHYRTTGNPGCHWNNHEITARIYVHTHCLDVSPPETSEKLAPMKKQPLQLSVTHVEHESREEHFSYLLDGIVPQWLRLGLHSSRQLLLARGLQL